MSPMALRSGASVNYDSRTGDKGASKMGSQPKHRYVVVHMVTHSRAERDAILDTHTGREVKSYRSPALAASDANFLNEHARLVSERLASASGMSGEPSAEALRLDDARLRRWARRALRVRRAGPGIAAGT